MQHENRTRIQISCRSILDLPVDTIVNSALADAKVGVPFHGKKTLDYMIYDAAGYKDMMKERKKYGYLKVAKCCTTSSYKLSERGIQRVIHVNVPRNDIRYNEKDSLVALAQCYYNVLLEAKKYNTSSIAFPLLGTGNKNFDEMTAIRVMRYGTEAFLFDYPDYPIDIVVSIISESAFRAAEFFFTRFDDPVNPYAVPEFNYDEAVAKGYFSGRGKKSLINETEMYERVVEKTEIIESARKAFGGLVGVKFTESGAFDPEIDTPFLIEVKRLKEKMDYSASKIAERANLSESQVKYILANNRNYDRESVIGLCFAFGLSLEESVELMRLAGFTFQEMRGDMLIMAGIRKMENIIQGRENKELPLGRVVEIEAEINDQLLEEKIDYVFIGKRDRYLGLLGLDKESHQ